MAHWEDLGGLITQDIWDPAPLLPPAGQMPVVMLQIDSAPPEIGTVSFNYETAVFEVMRHLADLGHRRVAFIGLSNLSDEPELRCPRYEAFVQAVKQLALEYDPRWSTDVRRAPQAREAMVRLLSAPPSRRPTAVLARDMVWPLLCEMARYRLVPGRDVSVVSLAHAEPWPRWLRCSRQLGDRMPWLYGQSDWLADLPDVAGEVVRYVPSVVASDARALGEAAVDEVHRRCQDFTRPPCRRRVGVAYHGGNTVGPPRPA